MRNCCNFSPFSLTVNTLSNSGHCLNQFTKNRCTRIANKNYHSTVRLRSFFVVIPTLSRNWWGFIFWYHKNRYHGLCWSSFYAVSVGSQSANVIRLLICIPKLIRKSSPTEGRLLRPSGNVMDFFVWAMGCSSINFREALMSCCWLPAESNAGSWLRRYRAESRLSGQSCDAWTCQRPPTSGVSRSPFSVDSLTCWIRTSWRKVDAHVGVLSRPPVVELFRLS